LPHAVDFHAAAAAATDYADYAMPPLPHATPPPSRFDAAALRSAADAADMPPPRAAAAAIDAAAAVLTPPLLTPTLCAPSYAAAEPPATTCRFSHARLILMPPPIRRRHAMRQLCRRRCQRHPIVLRHCAPPSYLATAFRQPDASVAADAAVMATLRRRFAILRARCATIRRSMPPPLPYYAAAATATLPRQALPRVTPALRRH